MTLIHDTYDATTPQTPKQIASEKIAAATKEFLKTGKVNYVDPGVTAPRKKVKQKKKVTM